jgi:hypothetical protein
MTSWPDHLPSGNQKRFWRDPVYGIAALWRQRIFIADAHIAATENVSLCVRMKSSALLLNLNVMC